MSRAVITKSLLTAIANAIRTKTGKSAQITPAQMATEIARITGTPPGFLIGDGEYPSSYTWPYSTMQQDQFCSKDARASESQFFSSFDFGQVSVVPNNAFYNSGSKLTRVSGNFVTSIGSYAFSICSALTEAIFPLLTDIGSYAFNVSGITDLPSSVVNIGIGGARMTKVSVLDLPNCESVGNNAFLGCSQLAKIRFQKLRSVGGNSFQNASSLTQFILDIGDSAAIPTMSGPAFTGTPIVSGQGYIYVTDSRINELKAATNWSVYATQVKGLSELPAN